MKISGKYSAVWLLSHVTGAKLLRSRTEDRFFSSAATAIILALLYCILFLGSISLQAQIKSTYRASRITVPDFSGNRSVLIAFQDHIGLLWAGTQNGLYFYDGVKTSPFILEGQMPELGAVYSINEDDHKRLWVCGNKGILVLNESRSAIVSAQELNIPASIFQSVNLNVCAGVNKALFILSGDVIYLFREGQISTWVTLQQGLIPVSGTVMYFVKRKQALIIHSRLQRTVFYLPKDGAVRYLQRGVSLTLSQIDEDFPLAFRNNPNFTADLLKFNDTVCDFVADRNKAFLEQMFISPVRDAVRQENESRTKYLANWRIFKLKDSTWAVSCTQGLFLLHPSELLFQQVDNAKGTRIRGLKTDKYNNLIYGTYDGLYWYNLDTKHGGLISKDSTVIWTIIAINTSNDRFMASGEGWGGKIMFLQSSPFGVSIDSIRVSGKQYSQCNSIIKDTINTKYWYTEGRDGRFNICSIDPKTFKSQILCANLNINDARSLAQTGSKLWIGSSNGLFVVDIAHINCDIYYGRQQKVPQPLQDAGINTLHANARGDLWIGTQNKGIYYFAPQLGVLKHYTKLDGLSDNTVFSITQTNDTTLWIGTGHGLSRFDIQKNWFQNYYGEDGLSDNEFNTAAAHFVPDRDILLIGGQNGINFFNPDRFLTDTSFSSIFLEITLTKHGRPSNKIFITEKSTITIAPNAALLEINFRSSSLLRGEQKQFRYRIHLLDQDWHYLLANDRAILTQLSPGTYIMEVQSRTSRGTWESSSHFSFVILPPWYKTWWFRGGIIFIVVASLYGAYRLRINYLRREFSLRQNISNDLHDDLGSRIFLLRSLSHQIANPLLKEEERTKSLYQFEHISKDTFKSIRDFIWAFDPQKDELEDMFERMDDFAENYLTPIIDHVEISRPNMTKSIKIEPRFKYHVMNIYQELLTNMVKHTFCERIIISFEYQSNSVNIHIQNHHQGYRDHSAGNEYTSSGRGISNIRHRIKELNGQIEWQEDEANTQSVSLSVPV